MLAVLSYCIGSIENSKYGSKDCVAALLDDSFGVHEGRQEEDDPLDDDDGGSAHSLKEGQLD